MHPPPSRKDLGSPSSSPPLPTRTYASHHLLPARTWIPRHHVSTTCTCEMRYVGISTVWGSCVRDRSMTLTHPIQGSDTCRLLTSVKLPTNTTYHRRENADVSPCPPRCHWTNSVIPNFSYLMLTFHRFMMYGLYSNALSNLSIQSHLLRLQVALWPFRRIRWSFLPSRSTKHLRCFGHAPYTQDPSLDSIKIFHNQTSFIFISVNFVAIKRL